MLGLVTAFLCPSLARAQDLPIIVTYELKKQRQEARIASQNPKAFWIRQIVARIEGKMPTLSIPLKQPVTVRLSFRVDRDGRLVSKMIATSSGDAEADKRAIAMLDAARPFPPMPAGMADAELSFTLPVRFR